MTLKERLIGDMGLTEDQIEKLNNKDLKNIKNAYWLLNQKKNSKMKFVGALKINELVYEKFGLGPVIPLESKYNTSDFTKAAA